MINPHELSIVLYNLTLIPIFFFSLIFVFFALFSFFIGEEKENRKNLPRLGKYPFITIQIPVFNDDCAAKCVEMCIEQDYPKERYEIIIVDDSTDKKTVLLLKEFAEKRPEMIKYVHRDNREGFKPGALQNVLPMSKGEIIVLFDSDWRPQKDFLRSIIQPFLDDDLIAIVQAKQAIRNLNRNLISRYAGYLLIAFHAVFMPIHRKTNTVFFCGTGGAIRTAVLKQIGGWNTKSLTEDADLSVKVMASGYKTAYLNLPVSSEVPHTFEGFVKQQMRWCYGMTRVFFDNIKPLLFSRNFTLRQKGMITFSTLGYVSAPVIIAMTFFGMMGWFTGEPNLL